MERRLLYPAKVLRMLQKTSAILEMVLADITPEQAHMHCDEDGGWNIIRIVYHLWDYEEVIAQRIEI